MVGLRKAAVLLPAAVAVASTSCSASPPAAQNTAGDDFTTQCAAFAQTLQASLAADHNATVWFSEVVPAGTNLTLADYDATCAGQRGGYQPVSVDLCRVSLLVPTSARSNITMEAWLPTPAAWTGRFLSTGNGGLSGCIQYDDLAYTAALGFATVATNNGHNGTRGFAFRDNADVVLDFAYRAMHTGVVVGKQLSALFYGAPHSRSYYFGCSTGGRQGLKEAQAYPEDFDGLVVGAPAVGFVNLTSWSGIFFPLTGTADAPTFVPAPLWDVVHADILAQCDGRDGYVDGIIEDAGLCSNYTPSAAILCSSAAANATASTCLTDVQAHTVQQIFAPLVHPDDGSLVFPAMQPGTEDVAQAVYYSGEPFPYTADWFRYAVYNDAAWDPATLGPADYSAAAAQNPGNIQTWEGDLSAARDRGAKILHYHGQQDAIITSYNSPRYYEHVAATMGQTPAELDAFYRFFKIGGMGHCDGGVGATFVGQAGGSNYTENPDGNVLTAMVRWVEEGVAPDTLLGTAFVNGTAESGEIAFQRRHCRYPLRTVYSGSGDPTKADSWTCVS